MAERAQLEQAIIALEAHRALLGDAVVDLVLAPLRQQLAALKRQVVTEQRKQVTVLFSDTAGFTAMAETMDPEDVRDVMQAYFSSLTAAITRFGGVVEKFIGDAVMAVFGIPTAHEHDPEYAVRAALAMHQALADLNRELERRHHVRLGMRIGINTGPVVVSFLSGAADTFAVVGDTVNLASRLERAAPEGGTLVSQATYRLVRRTFELMPLAPFPVKGKREPVQTYLVQSGRPSKPAAGSRLSAIEIALIGRHDALHALNEQLAAAVAEHEPYLVTVVGAAGIGKSRLVDEFVRGVANTDSSIAVVRGRADEAKHTVPYALIRDLLSSALELHTIDDPAQARQTFEQRVLGLLGTHAGETLPFIGYVIGFDYAAQLAGLNALNDARQIRDRAFKYMAELWTAIAAARPTVMLVDDIHWADDGSLQLLQYLVRSCPHVALLIVCSARPELFERFPLWIKADASHACVELGALSEQASEQLIRQQLRNMPRVPDELVRRLVSRAEGNPYYLRELIATLIEDGVIDTGADTWHVDLQRLAEHRIPVTLTGLLQARLDSLPAPERELLQQAAVVGRTFWDAALQHMSGTEAPAAATDVRETVIVHDALRLHERLAALLGKGLIVQNAASLFAATGEYSFSHTLMQQVAYESLLKRRRRVYHALAAAWLINTTGVLVGQYAGLIGEHYERAGEQMPAAEWYRQAARYAQSTYASETALLYHRRVLQVLAEYSSPTSATRRAEAWEGLGEMFLLLRRNDEAAEAFTAMQQAAQSAGDGVAQARAVYGLAEVYGNQLDYTVALNHALHAEELARAAAGDHEIVIARLMQSWCLLNLERPAEALALGEQVLLLSTELDATREMARCLNLLGAANRVLGDHKRATALMKSALVLHRERGDRVRIGATLNNLGMQAEGYGDYAAAAAYYEEALSTAREHADSELELQALGNLGGIRVRSGDYDTGEAELHQALRLAEQRAAFVPMVYCFLAEASAGRNEIEAALALACRALELAQTAGRPVLGAAWRTLGIVAGRLEPGSSPAEFGFGEHNSRPDTPDLRIKITHPEACFDESAHVFDDLGMQAERARTLRAWAEYEQQHGNIAGAAVLWDTARNVFDRLGLELEVERTEQARNNANEQ